MNTHVSELTTNMAQAVFARVQSNQVEAAGNGKQLCAASKSLIDSVISNIKGAIPVWGVFLLVIGGVLLIVGGFKSSGNRGASVVLYTLAGIALISAAPAIIGIFTGSKGNSC